MVLPYLEDGSIVMKLNIGGKTFNKIFYSEIEYKKFILSLWLKYGKKNSFNL